MDKKSIEDIFMDGTKLKQSLKHQGWNNINYGKPRDEETKKKISDSLKDYHNNISPFNDKDNNKQNSF